MAPLHNNASIDGIKNAYRYFGDSVEQIVVFDTAFHRNMPHIASQYAIPSYLSDKYPIKKYGFHGISYAFLWNSYEKYEGKKTDNKVIAAHLGNGCSIDAILDGVSIDTSMGFTPAEGLVMGTRAEISMPLLLIFFAYMRKKQQPKLCIY